MGKVIYIYNIKRYGFDSLFAAINIIKIMNYINYQIHLILQSRYKFLITIFIYFTIYITFYGQNISYCMTEGSDIPEIAETKTKSKVELTNLEQLIHRNIDSYIGDKDLIRSQQEEIIRLQKELAFIHEQNGAILGDDGVADAIANRGLQPYINEICRKHGQILNYPWIDENGNYINDYDS